MKVLLFISLATTVSLPLSLTAAPASERQAPCLIKGKNATYSLPVGANLPHSRLYKLCTALTWADEVIGVLSKDDLSHKGQLLTQKFNPYLTNIKYSILAHQELSSEVNAFAFPFEVEVKNKINFVDPTKPQIKIWLGLVDSYYQLSLALAYQLLKDPEKTFSNQGTFGSHVSLIKLNINTRKTWLTNNEKLSEFAKEKLQVEKTINDLAAEIDQSTKDMAAQKLEKNFIEAITQYNKISQEEEQYLLNHFPLLDLKQKENFSSLEPQLSQLHQLIFKSAFAFVIGHEIGHVVHLPFNLLIPDPNQVQPTRLVVDQDKLQTKILVSAISGKLSLFDQFTLLKVLKRSRKNELEADRFSYQYLKGWSEEKTLNPKPNYLQPMGSIFGTLFLKLMEEDQTPREGTKRLETHPPGQQRIDHLIGLGLHDNFWNTEKITNPLWSEVLKVLGTRFEQLSSDPITWTYVSAIPELFDHEIFEKMRAPTW